MIVFFLYRFGLIGERGTCDGPQKAIKYFKSIFYSSDEILNNSQKYFKPIFYYADETFETFSKPHFELQTNFTQWL